MLTQMLQHVKLPTRQPPAALTRQLHQRLATNGLDVPVRLFDGSHIGPDDSGYRILLTQPWSPRPLLAADDRTLGDAYLRGDLDVEGSMVAALRDLAEPATTLAGGRLRARLVGDVLRLPRPPSPARDTTRPGSVAGRLHSRERDRNAISHHYDVGNDFYRLFLDAQLVYSCAYFTDDDPIDGEPASHDLDRAQTRKLDLICRKLHLQPGDRLLDIGCGWGALAIHAATHFGVHAVGVTVSDQQVALARERARASDVDDRVEFRLQDYRDVIGSFDAVSSVGMFEHVGADQLASYFATCHRLTRPGGRFLNHGITTGRQGTVRDLADDPDSFVGNYVFPDGALVPAHTAVEHIEDAGFEVVDLEQLRPHYARTLSRWVARLEANAHTARAQVGDRTYRIWRAYMAASTIGFENGDLGVVQVLGTRTPTALPLGRRWMLPDATSAAEGVVPSRAEVSA